MVSEFSLLLQDVVLRGPAQVQNLARRIGKKYSTLVREVNPYDTGAKLGVDTLMDIMEVSRDMRPLVYMAAQLGCELHKAEKDPSQDQ